MTSQENEILEALMLTREHEYTISRAPKSHPGLINHKVDTMTRTGNEVTIETLMGAIITLQFDEFRLYPPSGTIALYRGDNQDERVIELSPNPHTLEFDVLLSEVGVRLHWPAPRTDGLE